MFSVIQEAACVYESTFTMTGGTISENTAEDGAGAYIYCGTFTMNGGTISKNTAEYGAGVYLEYDTFTMTGGTIAENEAGGDGGGVKVIGGTFAMTGGDIIGNSAEQGGGVRVYNGTFTMENGTITNNTATESGGGVLLNKSIERGYYTGIGKLTLSGGNPVICGNTAGQAADNTRFTETDLFTLAGSLGDNAEVRITSPDAKQYASFGTVSGTPNGAEHIILDEKNFTGAVNGSSLIWGDVTLHKHDGITFVPWTSSTKLPTSGNYHLVCDVTLTSHCALSGDLNLCLNGYVIRMNGKQSAFLVENGHTLNLYEDIPAKHYFTVSETNGVLNRDDSKTAGDIRLEDITSTADLTNGKVIEVTGGCITGSTEDGSGGGVYVNGGTFIMHQGNIIGNKPESGGGVYVRAGSFTMKSGSVAGNVATKSDGGGVYVSDNGKFVMDSGLIIGNSAKSNGGGVLVYNSAGKFTMNGGSIRANHANHGGGVWNGGEFLIPASTSLDVSSITGNGATSGGGVFVSGGGSSFTMYGGAITNNTAACYGGGVYFNGSTFDLMNGIITGNSTNGADNDSDGGGVYVNGGMFKLSGGITNIKENTKNGEANNVQLTGGTLRLAGNLWEGADIRITGPEPVPGAEFGSASDSPTGAIYIQSDDETMFGRVDGSSLVWEKRIDVPVAKISSGTEFSSVQAAVVAVEAGSSDTVTLLRNAVSDETVTVIGEVILDLAGHTIRNIGNDPVITILGGNLTLKDSGSVIGSRTGKITGGHGVMGCGVYVSDYGKFVMEGGTITKNRAEYGSGVYVASKGTFIMAGGTIAGNIATKSDGGGVYVKEGGTVILSGGTPVIKDNLYREGANNLRLTGTSQLQLTGTLTSGADIRITSPKPVYGESFGTASETAGGANLIKSDGGDLFGKVSGSSLIWTREGSTSVAKINDREFLTVQAAINAAATGDTVTLLTDAASDETVTLAGKKITLDLAGHALSLSRTGSGPVITVKSNEREYHGILTLKDSTGGGKITGGHGTTGGGVYVGEGSTFTIVSGSITQNTASVAGGGVYAAEGGTFEMEGGDIIGNSAPAGGGAYIDNGMFILCGGTPVISGNTDTGESPLVNNLWLTGPDQFDLTGVLGEGADIRITCPSPVLNDRFGTASETAGGAEKITPDGGSFRGLIRDGMLIWDEAPVAKISSGTEFSSVQAAVNAASSGDTVTLLTNAKSGDTITISKKEITLDLSGYVLSTTGSKPVITIGTLGILTVTDSNPDEKHYFTNASGLYVYAGDEQTGGLTEVTGGCITGGSSVNGGGVSISDGGTLTLAGGNIIGNSASDDGGGVYASGLYVGGSFVMTGGNIIGNSAKSNGGSVYVAGGSSFVMKGGSITENTGEWCCGGVYVYSGTFTMNGGSITKNNGGTYGGGVNVSYGKFIISGGNPVIKENTRGTGNQAYAANVQLSATNQLELTGTLGESAEIYVTSPDTMRGSIFGTASDTAGGAEHIISDIKIDDKPVSGIIFNTLLMWDDTEEKTDIGFGSSMSVNAPVSNDLQSAPPNDTGDLTADLRSLDYMVESVALHDVDTANPGRYKLNYKASSALWDEFNLPMMMESSLYVKPFKLEITCDGEPFDARLTVTFKVDKENVKKVITERKDVMLGHLNGNNKWELIKADMVTQVSEDDQYLHFSVTAQEPTAFFAAAVMEKPVTIPVDNGTAEFEDDGDIKVLSGCDAAYDIQLTRVTNLTNGSEVQLRESNSNPVAVTILENHLEKLLQDDPSLDSQIISVFGVRVMNSAGSEVSTGGVLTLKVVLKDGYSPEYVRFYHFETRAWALLSSEYLGGIEYSIPTRSFSPFAVVYAEPKEKPTPVPASSSSQQGSSTWLTETPTPTPAPTPTPTGTPAPEMPQVKPLETKQAASPAPFIGVLAELGCAAVVFGLRRK